MNKKISPRKSLAVIANEAIEQLRCDKEQASWMEALMRAIRADLKTGAHGAAALAGLGQYLACDLANYIDCQVEQLQRALDAAEGRE
ncbi:hypothetical protein IMW75_11110 [Pseudomonas gregormendelii]|uniref:Uncharacterized protein n=1 Tax=Pseudomonas gregormendelii TaxID=1628277 RepID=A0ABS3AFT6_9PSED|nr:hypothetical protein [Pseudomonas gregormendelii]MBN3965827.1 hypothetical protein [Pseudomonas gregormendelii]